MGLRTSHPTTGRAPGRIRNERLDRWQPKAFLSWTWRGSNGGVTNASLITPGTSCGSNARLSCGISRSSSADHPGVRALAPSGLDPRLLGFITPRRTGPGPCTGTTATHASTSPDRLAPSPRVDDLRSSGDSQPSRRHRRHSPRSRRSTEIAARRCAHISPIASCGRGHP